MNKVVPVTVLDISNWVVTQVKTKERDGYNAVQVGCIKDKHAQATFSDAWLKKPNAYFQFFKEITCMKMHQLNLRLGTN